MATDTQAAPSPTWMYWTGWILSGLSALGLAFSAAMKFMPPSEEMTKGFAKLGYGLDLAIPLGVVELVCTIIYLIPRTSFLGAILLTGYLGGAVATHVRIYDVGDIVPPIIVGVLVWGGLYLRDGRLRSLLPLRS